LTVAVTESEEMTDRGLRLHVGWNLVSTNVEPAVATLEDIFALPVAAEALVVVKNAAGEFYRPEFGFNNIDHWVGTEGYWVKMLQSFNLRIAGQPTPPDLEIPLTDGWNIAAYLPRTSIDAAFALGGLGESLVIAKEERGRFLLPAWEFNDIGDMMEGKGYQLLVSGDQTLVYQLPEGVGGAFEPRYNAPDVLWLDGQLRTSLSYNLLLLAPLPAGTRVTAATPAGVVAGRGVVGSDGKCGLTLWGDDPATEDVEGFAAGETAVLSVAGDLKWLAGSAKWTDGGWGVAQLGVTAAPAEFGLTGLYPNPFNSILRVAFALTEASEARVAVYDLGGRAVAELASGRMTAGSHSVVWRAGDVPSGIYIVKLSAKGEARSAKALLLK